MPQMPATPPTPDLPVFRYHPDPIATGAVEPSDTRCVCCKQPRGFIYKGPVYSEKDGLDDAICPWCIADGSAAKKFRAIFTDDSPLEDEIPAAKVREVTCRTPGFTAWQQEVWLACCKDACAFLGDAPAEELRALEGERLEEALESWFLDEKSFQEILAGYEPGGDPAFYKFQCLHCGKVHYGWDCT